MNRFTPMIDSETMNAWLQFGTDHITLSHFHTFTIAEYPPNHHEKGRQTWNKFGHWTSKGRLSRAMNQKNRVVGSIDLFPVTLYSWILDFCAEKKIERNEGFMIIFHETILCHVHEQHILRISCPLFPFVFSHEHLNSSSSRCRGVQILFSPIEDLLLLLETSLCLQLETFFDRALEKSQLCSSVTNRANRGRIRIPSIFPQFPSNNKTMPP
jgi:hypothetical protein